VLCVCVLALVLNRKIVNYCNALPWKCVIHHGRDWVTFFFSLSRFLTRRIIYRYFQTFLARTVQMANEQKKQTNCSYILSVTITGSIFCEFAMASISLHHVQGSYFTYLTLSSEPAPNLSVFHKIIFFFFFSIWRKAV
jgi:hypothetical protein